MSFVVNSLFFSSVVVPFVPLWSNPLRPDPRSPITQPLSSPASSLVDCLERAGVRHWHDALALLKLMAHRPHARAALSQHPSTRRQRKNHHVAFGHQESCGRPHPVRHDRATGEAQCAVARDDRRHLGRRAQRRRQSRRAGRHRAWRRADVLGRHRHQCVGRNHGSGGRSQSRACCGDWPIDCRMDSIRWKPPSCP